MLGLGKSKELSRTENGEVNFQGWPSGKELFSPAVAVLFVLFWGGGETENHTSLPKEVRLVQARKLNLRTDGDGACPCLRAVPHLDYSSEDIHSADIASLGWSDKKQSKTHRSFSVRSV